MQWLIVQSIALKLQDRICETSLKTVRFQTQQLYRSGMELNAISLLIFLAKTGENS